MKKCMAAIWIAAVLAVGGFLAWWYLPRPLVRDLPLVKVQIFDAKTGVEMDLTEQVDLPAMMELLGEAECCPQWRPGPHSNEEYPLDIKFSGGGEHWIVILGSRGGFAVDNSKKLPGVSWKAVSCGRSSSPCCRNFEYAPSPFGGGEKINMTGEVTAV